MLLKNTLDKSLQQSQLFVKRNQQKYQLSKIDEGDEDNFNEDEQRQQDAETDQYSQKSKQRDNEYDYEATPILQMSHTPPKHQNVGRFSEELVISSQEENQMKQTRKIRRVVKKKIQQKQSNSNEYYDINQMSQPRTNLQAQEQRYSDQRAGQNFINPIANNQLFLNNNNNHKQNDDSEIQKLNDDTLIMKRKAKNSIFL
eukprot:403332643